MHAVHKTGGERRGRLTAWICQTATAYVFRPASNFRSRWESDYSDV